MRNRELERKEGRKDGVKENTKIKIEEKKEIRCSYRDREKTGHS